MTVFLHRMLWMALCAGAMILAVLILRLLMKRTSKNGILCLWALVAIRLMVPFSFQSTYAILPQMAVTETPEGITVPEQSNKEEIVAPIVPSHDQFPVEGSSVTAKEESFPTQTETTKETSVWSLLRTAMMDRTRILFGVWLCGLFAMGTYAIYSYRGLCKKVAVCEHLREDIYLCDYVDIPFVLGVVHTRIYLPAALEEADQDAVLAHEREHKRHYDPFWKLLGYTLLAIFWFQPLCWLAYYIFCKDLEMACDERVIWNMDLEERKRYSEALLHMSIKRNDVAFISLTFTKGGNVLGRINKVLEFRKPSRMATMLAVLCMVTFGACFMTEKKDTRLIDHIKTENDTEATTVQTSVIGDTTSPVYETDLIYGLSLKTHFDGILKGEKDSPFSGYLKFSDDQYMYYVHPEKKYVANIIMTAEKITSTEQAKKSIGELADQYYRTYNPYILAEVHVQEPVQTPLGIRTEVIEQVDGVAIGAYASFLFDENHNLLSATIVPCYELPKIEKSEMIGEQAALEIAIAEIYKRWELTVPEGNKETEIKIRTWKDRTFYEFELLVPNGINGFLTAMFMPQVDVYTGEVIAIGSNMVPR